MAIFYVLLTVSAILFASQFLLTKQFQRFNGDSLYSTLKLTLFAYVTIAVFFFVKANIGASQLKFGFSIFTLLMTLGIAVVSMTCMYLGVKVLGIGNMSVYSVFMMVGSMVLPSLVGLVFYGEELTWLKGVAILLMLVSIVFMTNKDDTKANKKALFFYVGVFILNGLVGVLFTIHQNQPLLSAYYEVIDGVAVSNSDVFMSWYGISTAVLAGIILIVYKIVNKGNTIAIKNQETVSEKNNAIIKTFLLSILVAIGYGLSNGFGNYFVSLSTSPNALGSSVTFPIVNGGTILFSTLLGFFIYKEKITWRTIVGFALVLVSTILFMFAQ